MENIISEEVAKVQVDKFKDYYDVDLDDFPKDVKAGLVASYKRMARAVRAGRLEIDTPEGTIVIKQHLEKAPEGIETPMVYKELDGSVKGKIPDNLSSHDRLNFLIGILTGEGATVVEKLRGKDMPLAEALGLVFLQI